MFMNYDKMTINSLALVLAENETLRIGGCLFDEVLSTEVEESNGGGGWSEFPSTSCADFCIVTNGRGCGGVV